MPPNQSAAAGAKLSAPAAALIRGVGDAIAPRGKGQGRVCVMNYHRVLRHADPLLESEPDVDTFRWQMRLLKECFNVIPLHDAVMAVRDQRIAPRTVCITFDDGYRAVHDLALPVLKEFGLPATVFVTSGYVGESHMWNDRIIEAVESIPSGELNLQAFGLGVYSLRTLDDRKIAVARLTASTKYMPPHARDELIDHLEKMVGDNLAHGLMLNRQMVVNLAREGIEIGAHTISHPILTSLDDAEARREIVDGKLQLEEMTGKPVRLFAYPNGKVGMDFDERHARMVREAGFDAAFTTEVGSVNSTQDKYQLPRSRPWDTTPFRFGLRLLRWLAR